MTAPALTFDDEADTLVVTIAEDVDMTNATELLRVIEHAVQPRHRRLVLDLAGVGYLDSAGVHVLFLLGRRLEERGQTLALVVPDGSVTAATLRHAHATEAFACAPTVAGALDGR